MSPGSQRRLLRVEVQPNGDGGSLTLAADSPSRFRACSSLIDTPTSGVCSWFCAWRFRERFQTMPASERGLDIASLWPPSVSIVPGRAIRLPRRPCVSDAFQRAPESFDSRPATVCMHGPMMRTFGATMMHGPRQCLVVPADAKGFSPCFAHSSSSFNTRRRLQRLCVCRISSSSAWQSCSFAVLVWLGVASLVAESRSTILGVKPHRGWLKSVLNQHENPFAEICRNLRRYGRACLAWSGIFVCKRGKLFDHPRCETAPRMVEIGSEPA